MATQHEDQVVQLKVDYSFCLVWRDSSNKQNKAATEAKERIIYGFGAMEIFE